MEPTGFPWLLHTGCCTFCGPCQSYHGHHCTITQNCHPAQGEAGGRFPRLSAWPTYLHGRVLDWVGDPVSKTRWMAPEDATWGCPLPSIGMYTSSCIHPTHTGMLLHKNTHRRIHTPQHTSHTHITCMTHSTHIPHTHSTHIPHKPHIHAPHRGLPLNLTCRQTPLGGHSHGRKYRTS